MIGDEPAYPTPFTDGMGGIFQGVNENKESMWASNPGGLTKLEDFTKAAMQGILSNPNMRNNIAVGVVSDLAIEIAMATLKKLEDVKKVTDKLTK